MSDNSDEELLGPTSPSRGTTAAACEGGDDPYSKPHEQGALCTHGPRRFVLVPMSITIAATLALMSLIIAPAIR